MHYAAIHLGDFFSVVILGLNLVVWRFYWLALLQGIVPQFFFQYTPFSEDRKSVDRTRRCFATLDECFKQLQDHVSDEEPRIQLTQDFLQHYDQALSNMSCWLDDFQLRLVNSQFEIDIDKAFQDIQVVYKLLYFY